ncbi:hypothetical protein GGI02_004950, partial [Coemansia sp. RSA 2322]
MATRDSSVGSLPASPTPKEEEQSEFSAEKITGLEAGLLDKIDELPAEAAVDADEEEEKVDPIAVYRLFRFANRADLVLIALGSFCSMAAGVIAPAMTVVFSSLIQTLITFNMWMLEDKVSEAHDLLGRESRKYCLWFFILGLVQWTVSYGVNVCWAMAAERQGRRIREAYYRSIMRQDIGWFDTVKTGSLTTRITNDVNLVQDGLGEKFGFIFMNVVSFVTGLIISLVKAWDVALICMCILPFMIASAAMMGRRIARWMTFAQDKTASSGAVADEVLGGIRTVQAFNGQERELARYRTKIQESYEFGKKKGLVLGAGFGSIQFFIFSMYTAGFNFGIWRIYTGVRTPQQLLNSIFALLIGGFALGGTAPHLSAVTTAQGSAAKVFAVIDRQSAIDPLDTERGQRVEKVAGAISFRDVHFSYPRRAGVAVLRGFSVEIGAGQKVALVGESGSGKSTVVGLIERFYDAAQGVVAIDGVDIRELNVGMLRQHIGVVTQEPVLFATTIRQNIAWGAVDADAHPRDVLPD